MLTYFPASLVPGPEFVLDLTDVATFDVPSGFDDSEGTLYLEGPTAGGTVRVAYAWDSSGFLHSIDGAIAEYDQWPIPWTDPQQDTPGSTYYVDSTAGTGGDGSQGDPWDALADIPTLSAGDTVVFVDGSVFTGTLDITESGEADNVIKFTRSGGGAKPIIQGDGATTDYAMQIYAQSYIWVDGIRFRNAGYGINNEADGQIRITGGNETTLLCDYVTLTNIECHNSGTTGGYMNDDVHHFTLKDCNVYSNPQNGWLFNSGDTDTNAFNVMRGVTFWDNCSADAGDHVVNGIGGNTAVFGCRWYNNHNTDHYLYRGHTPKGSLDAWYGAVKVFECSFEEGDTNRSNYPLGMKGQGLHAYRVWTSGCTQWAYCPQLPTGTGALGDLNLTDCHHSIATDVDKSGVANEAHCIGVSNLTGFEADGEADLAFWNMTLVDAAYGFHVDATNMAGIDTTEFVATNCIIQDMTDGGARLQKDDGFAVLKYDYNAYYNVNANWVVPGDATNTFAEWQGLDGDYDPNSTHGTDPKLVDPDNATVLSRNFALQADSPCKNAGSWAEMRRLDDINAHVGMNYCPTTEPSKGAYEYIAGTTGDRTDPILAQTWTGDWTIVRLSATKASEAELNTWTGG